jgi:hypothetical protein
VIQNKINEHHTYLDAMNYWTPLNDDNDKNEEDEEKMNTLDSKTAITEPKSNKRMRWLAGRREHKLTSNPGATSNFVCKELDLPKDGVSNMEVFLPDNSKLRRLHKTKLPFEQLSDAAREACILPGLKRSLLRENKMSEEGYTTIFHPGEEGINIHKKGTLPITTSKPPELSKGAKVIKKNYGWYQQIKMIKSVKRQTMHTAYHQFHRQ